MTGHAIHHVTAIAGGARRLVEFYGGTLGLRLIKKTVNFDDPSAYHLYAGDRFGMPGTIMTFFTREKAPPGRPGPGAQEETSFRVPLSSLSFWADRLRPFGAARDRRFGETVLRFTDPEGLPLALVGVAGAEAEPAWPANGVPETCALRGFAGVRLLLDDATATAAVLVNVFGFVADGVEAGTQRFRVTDATWGGVVDLRVEPGGSRNRQGRGSVHHLAFRAADDDAQAAMAAKLAKDHGLHATEQRNRDYFRSVYFHSPGGVLFEIATDPPGFTVDEAEATLGTELKLPRFLRPRRAAIEAALPVF